MIEFAKSVTSMVW